jgi:hypothetical protein
MKKIIIAALLISAALQSRAEDYGSVNFDCSDYFGFNICAASLESTAKQIAFVEANQNGLSTQSANRSPSFSTSPNSEVGHQINKASPFKNSDSFRAYMKTLGSTGSANTDSEFSLTKRILDDKNFGLDCRVITGANYELSSSYSYDCALQRYF